MITIGLTGGIATGKNIIAGLFEKKGAQIIDADKIGHELLREPSVKNEIITLFGKGIITKSQCIDREKLAGIVFNSKEELKKLNTVLHPRIIKGISEEIRIFSAVESVEVIVVNAALLFEFGIEDLFSYIVLVYSDRQKQIERCIKRGLSAAEAQSRIAAQIPHDEIIARTDFEIENNGSLDELTEKIYPVWEKIIHNERNE